MAQWINWKAFSERPKRFLLIDLGMLTLALIHLSLLLFDMTYFSMRPYYLRIVPALAQTYDPVKGVEKHRFTQTYLRASDTFFENCPSADQQQRMRELSAEMIEENPFQRANMTGILEQIKERMRQHTAIENSSKQAFNYYWNNACAPGEKAFFERDIAPLIAQNYWRRIGTNGNFINYFWYLELFFISLYLLEFCVSWVLAIRRFGKEQRVLYPIYHWYDLVSCIPFPQFRFLRLLRVGIIVYRLIRSDYINLKNSKTYTAMIRYQRIIMEEISDQVALNILNNIQAKTRLGTNRDLLEETLNAHRTRIRDVAVSNLQHFELPTLQTRQPEIVAEIADVVMESIEATEEYQNLIRLPLVRPVVERIVNPQKIAGITEQAMDAFLEHWQERLQSEQMQSLLKDLIDDVLDQAVGLSLNQQIQDLIEDINLQILEELKASSTAKIWKAEQNALLIEKVAEQEEQKPSLY